MNRYPITWPQGPIPSPVLPDVLPEDLMILHEAIGEQLALAFAGDQTALTPALELLSRLHQRLGLYRLQRAAESLAAWPERGTPMRGP